MNIPKILVVDDLDIREFYAKYLRRQNYAVFIAASGEEGWEIFQKRNGRIL